MRKLSLELGEISNVVKVVEQLVLLMDAVCTQGATQVYNKKLIDVLDLAVYLDLNPVARDQELFTYC